MARSPGPERRRSGGPGSGNEMFPSPRGAAADRQDAPKIRSARREHQASKHAGQMQSPREGQRYLGGSSVTRSVTATAIWFGGPSSIARNCGPSVEIKPPLDTIALPESLKLPGIVLRSDSKSHRCQNRSSHRDTRCSSRGTLATLPAENDGRPDSPPGPDVQQHAIEALRQSDQLLHAEIATPALPQLVNHLRKPRPASIARWHDWTSSASPVRRRTYGVLPFGVVSTENPIAYRR